MAEVGALVRELVLEELRAGEVLEIRIIDPTLAHLFVRQRVDVLEQQEPDDEAGRDPGPAMFAVERRDLAIDPVPVDLAGELHQLVLHVDDLVEPGAELQNTKSSFRFGVSTGAAICEPMPRQAAYSHPGALPPHGTRSINSSSPFASPAFT